MTASHCAVFCSLEEDFSKAWTPGIWGHGGTSIGLPTTLCFFCFVLIFSIKIQDQDDQEGGLITTVILKKCWEYMILWRICNNTMIRKLSVVSICDSYKYI